VLVFVVEFVFLLVLNDNSDNENDNDDSNVKSNCYNNYNNSYYNNAAIMLLWPSPQDQRAERDAITQLLPS